MNILLAHNHYRGPGGEDAVFEAEISMLRSHGHSVVEFRVDNSTIEASSVPGSIRLGLQTSWSQRSYHQFQQIIAHHRPDVAHFHNTFPLISPAAYYACKHNGVPVVQTLHNYRLFCPKASFFRGGTVCEECVEHTVLRALRYGCYRHSRMATASVASMLLLHRCLGTWTGVVDSYVALSNFGRDKFINMGLPADKVMVKPNFVPEDPVVGSHKGGYALFLGRLVEEKGINVVVKSWSRAQGIPLWVAGDGPLRSVVEEALHHANSDNVKYLGWVSRDKAIQLLKEAHMLVFPSQWYEGFPMTIAEAYACGTPVIASRLGAMQEIVHHGRTGLHFAPGDAADLASTVEWACSHPEEMREMGRNARGEFEEKYTAAANYEMLMAIYHSVIAAKN
jgi:glycosyltransferase involved in cell wall biosynthesis